MLTCARRLIHRWTLGQSRVCNDRKLNYSLPSVGSSVPYKQTLRPEERAASPHIKQPTTLPTRADVVIIGGGVSGCSALYHLAKLGVRDVVLIEKDALTAGTTWHTAGLVWHLRPSDVEVQLLSCSWDLMKSLELETGLNTGYIQNGGLFIASSKERLDEYQRLATLGKVYNVESHVLGPKETQQLYPLMNVSDIYGTLYSPTDGTIDPAGYCTALSRAAHQMVGKPVVFENTAVTGIGVAEENGVKRVTHVDTKQGRIQTKCLVNAAGCWAPMIGQMAQVKVPLCAMKHAYIVSERIEGIQNMPNVRDHDASVYLRLQGDALSIGGYEPNPVFWDPKPEGAFTLFDLDWDVFSVNIEGAVNRVPVIEKTGIKSTVCGPESFTADHKPLLGESPEVRGYYLSCGYNSSGMMLSGGCGRELAHWIVHGRPQLDMFSYDIRRFTERLTNNQNWIKERSHESYAKNYSIVYQHDAPLAGRNMLKDVLHQRLLEQGCIYEERQGFERPSWFSQNSSTPKVLPYDYYGYYGNTAHADYDYANHLKLDYTFDFPKQHHQIGQECLSCRQKVALFNMSYFGKYYLTGPDASAAADWLFSANVARPAGQTVYTCLLNPRGGTEADLTVSVLDEAHAQHIGQPHCPKLDSSGKSYYLAIGGAVSQYVSSYIREIIQDKKFNCHLVDHSLDMVLLSLQGPYSRALLQSLTDADLSNEAFAFSTHRTIEVAGRPCRALRLSFVGELGWELHIPNENALHIYNALMDTGKKWGISNAGYRAIDSLSLEKGYRHWHSDLRADDTPLEAGLGFTCKFKSDVPFIGREALEKQKKEGLKKKIALFSTVEPIMLHGLEAVMRNGEVIGFLRRAEYGFAVNKSMGYAYVSVAGQPHQTITTDYLNAGEYEIERMGVRHKALFHPKSLFDPQNKRVQGVYDNDL